MSNTEIKLIAVSTAVLITATLTDAKKAALDAYPLYDPIRDAMAAELSNLKVALDIHKAELAVLKAIIG